MPISTSRTRSSIAGLPEPGARLRIFGIDPGSYATGFGIIDQRGGSIQEIECGAIRPPRGQPFLVRIGFIHDAIAELILRSRPDEVAVENTFHALNARSTLQMGQARAAAILPAVKSGLPIFEYAPRQVKLAVTGYGGAGKEQVAKMVAILLRRGAAPPSFDAADALAVALCHAHRQADLRHLQTTTP